MSNEAFQIAAAAVRHYAETHPRPSQVTMSQAADMLGLSRQTVGRMVRAGTIRLNKCGLIPVNEVDRVLSAGRDE